MIEDVITQEELNKAALDMLPEQTHPDKFTEDMRNKAADFGRLCFIKGAEYILKHPQIVCRRFE